MTAAGASRALTCMEASMAGPTAWRSSQSLRGRSMAGTSLLSNHFRAMKVALLGSLATSAHAPEAVKSHCFRPGCDEQGTALICRAPLLLSACMHM